MAKNRVVTFLMCEESKEKNYTQVVSRKRTVGSLRLRKYCAKLRKYTWHKEVKSEKKASSSNW